MKKYQSFSLSENVQFLEVKFSIYLNWRVFVMKSRCQKHASAHEIRGLSFVDLF